MFIDDMMDQSTLNRFLTQIHFTVGQLNDARLDLMQLDGHTAFKGGKNEATGALILDDTLLRHYGPKKEKVAWLKDPHDQSYPWSHNLVNLHYSDNETDYPVDFRLWEPADLEKIEAAFKSIDIAICDEIRQQKSADAKAWRKYLVKKYNDARSKPRADKAPIEVVYKTKLGRNW